MKYFRGRFSKRREYLKSKSAAIDNYINQKACEECRSMDKQEQMLLCDRCDDAYHAMCHKPPIQLPLSEDQQWLCPPCLEQEQIQHKRDNKMVVDIYSQPCFKCKQRVADEVVRGTNSKGETVQIPHDSLKPMRCLYCHEVYHATCFSRRIQSLNCWACESKIRKEGPLSHSQFIGYIEEQNRETEECKYLKLWDRRSEPRGRYSLLGLKVPLHMNSWQIIVQHEASIYYALKTKRITFVDEQIYADEEVMSKNNPQSERHIYSLALQDEEAFLRFKENSKRGYIGPFEIKEDRVKGFYLVATDFIQKLTIVSEYVGEVMTSRNALNKLNNDSIFILIRTPHSSDSLDVVPTRHGNISRFFSGINNDQRESFSHLENIKVVRFELRGRVRLLFYTSKDVQAGETLYFNYNGGPFQEYPTENFIK